MHTEYHPVHFILLCFFVEMAVQKLVKLYYIIILSGMSYAFRKVEISTSAAILSSEMSLMVFCHLWKLKLHERFSCAHVFSFPCTPETLTFFSPPCSLRGFAGIILCKMNTVVDVSIVKCVNDNVIMLTNGSC